MNIRYTTANLPNDLRTYSKLFGKCYATSPCLWYSSNTPYLVVCKYLKLIVSSLSVSIMHILSSITEKKMFGVRARWVVADMKYPFAFWNRSVMKYPRKSMSVNPPSWRGKREFSISKFAFGTTPIPTLIRFLDSPPKSIFNRFRRTTANTMGANTVKSLCSCKSMFIRIGEFFQTFRAISYEHASMIPQSLTM